MRAMIIERFGGLEELTLSEQPKPIPAENEVLIRVRCAGVNPVDWKIREGLLVKRLLHSFPIICGWEAAGIIEKVSEKVTDFAAGDEVYAYCRKPTIQWGTYAEYVTMLASAVAPKPKNISFAEAAGIPLAGLTAWQSLFDHADLKRGQVVLIHAGAGGVGSHAIQFARQAGAIVLTTASPNHRRYVERLGAEVVIDYNREDFIQTVRARYPDGVDAVFDTIGGETQSRSYEALKSGGVLVSIAHPPDESEATRFGVKGLYCFVEPNGRQLREIGSLIEQGVVKPPSIEVFPLEEAAEAQRLSKAGHVQGKIVLRIG